MLGDVEVRGVSFASYFGKHAVSLNCVNMWKLFKSVFFVGWWSVVKGVGDNSMSSVR